MKVTNFFRQNPLLRIIIPFIIGILSVPHNATYINKIHISILIILFLIFIFSAFFLIKFYKYKHKWINGLISIIYFYIIAYILTSLTFENKNNEHFSYSKNNDKLLIVEIKNTKKSQNNCIKAEADVLYKSINKKWTKTRGRILINIQTNGTKSCKQICYGNRLIICCNYYEIQAPKNPGDFDYKDFLTKKRIFHQAKLDSNNYIFIGENKYSLRGLTQKIREKLLNIFTYYGIKDQEYAVSSALVFGYGDELDNETRKQYTSAGAMHILCVSGMHVGVVYLVINFIISIFTGKNKKNKLKPILIILSIWFYAMLTGLAPSVFRASAMLSFVIIGNSLSRKTSIYNTLCASALLILICDPQLIKNIGFQLSYIAVLGIVTFYEPIRKIYLPKNKFIQKTWELIAVSIAAQIATCPLAMLYFNQFPNYFILTNLIAAPLSGFIIYTAIATIIISPVNWAGNIFAQILNYLILILNNSLAIIEDLPYSVTTGININQAQCILIYGIIISFFLTIETKRKFCMWLSLTLLLILFTFSSIKDIFTSNKRLFVVFNNYNGSVIGFYNGKNSLVLADTNIISKSKNSSMQPAWEKVYEGIKKTIAIPIDKKYLIYHNFNFRKEEQLIHFYRKKIIILDKYFYLNRNCKYKYEVDCIVIKKNYKINNAEEVLNLINPKMVIIEGNVPQLISNKWKKYCTENSINFFDVKKNGAFILNINNN